MFALSNYVGSLLTPLLRFKGITSDLFPGVVLPEPDFGAFTSKLEQCLGPRTGRSDHGPGWGWPEDGAVSGGVWLV